MYPITNEVKALFEAEQPKVLRITGKPLKKDNVSVGPSDIVTVNDAAAIPAKDITIAIEPVQAGSGDPSPTNVRPISGWTGANVARTGKNLAEKADNIIGNLSVNVADDGTLTINGTSSTYCYIRGYFNCPDESATYTWALFNPNVVAGVEFSVMDRNIAPAGGWAVVNTPYMTKTFVPDSGKKPVYWRFQIAPGITFNNAVFKPMIVLGNSAPEIYESYEGTTYPISWQSEAGTVYGGTLDVTTGLLTVTHVTIEYDGSEDENWYSGTYGAQARTYLPDNVVAYTKSYEIPNIKSNYLNPAAQNGEWKPGDVIRFANSKSLSVVFDDTGVMTSSQARTYLASKPLQIVYELATPQTYQLTPNEVTLRLGVNNVWADTGKTALTYRPYADLVITDDNVIEDSFQIDRYSCNGEKLEVGTAIAAQMTLQLFNGNGQYDSIVFEGAELNVEIGIADWTQSSPTVTYIPCGYFTPDEQPRRLSTISITALDRMMRFDAVSITKIPWTTRSGEVITTDSGEPIYFVKSIRFPCTIAQIVAQAAAICNVPFTQDLSGFPNANISIQELPVPNKDITYRTLIQWCAAIMGCNAWIDWTGVLRFSWYDNATDYVSTIDNRYSSDLYENDLSITGVAYTNNSGIQFVEGSADYTVDIVGNLLIGAQVATMLPAINAALNGFTYRPFTAAAVNAPYLWPMDSITFRDKDGNDHTSALTNVAFGLNGTTAMESKGMTYATNRGAQPSGFTKEQAQLVNEVKQSIVDLDDSLTQEEIFNRLTDNGAAQGIVLYNGQLYVNASYMRTGTLVANLIKAGVLGDLAGKNYWNMETGEFSLSATATVGGSTVEDIAEQAVDEFDETLTQQDVFNRLTDNGAAQGIILSNGQLYINASYIQTGTLTLGGLNNQNGTLRVLNAAGQEIGAWTKDGIQISAGSIQLSQETLTSSVEVLLQQSITEPFKIIYNSNLGEIVTKLVGEFFSITNTDNDSKIQFNHKELFFSDGSAVWFYLSYNNGSPYMNIYGDAFIEGDTRINGNLTLGNALTIGGDLSVSGTVDDKRILQAASAVSIPSVGNTVTVNITGLTSNHQLVRWNFSSSPENAPPADLEWETFDGYFTITNHGGTTSESITPVFILPQ